MAEATEILLRSLFLGVIYAVAAAGLALIFGVMRVVNAAHGELVMLGGYIAYLLWSGAGFHPLLALAAATLIMAGFGVLLQRLVLERVVGKPEMSSLLLTFGVSLILVDLARGLFTTTLRSIVYLQEPVTVLGVSYARNNLITLVLGLGVGAGLFAFLNYHPLGKAVRATAQNEELALACGIDCRLVRVVSLGLGAALAGLAGTVWAINYSLFPGVGQNLIITLFAIVVLGGMGSVGGAFLGGIVLGLAQVVTARYLTTQLSLFTAFVLLLGILLIRPQGLFGTGAGDR
jgi:branched-chain amino acid transport system permease protein